MRIELSSIFVGLSLAAAAAAQAPSPLPPKQAREAAAARLDDKGLRDAASSELTAVGVPIDTVRVDVDGGRVTLDGFVSSYAEKARATEAVSKLRGVVAVKNDLEIAAAPVADDELRTNVERALRADPATDEYRVTISARDGTVRLGGTVDSWQEKLLASKIAGRVEGVRDIDNELEVREPRLRDDAALTTDVKQRLRFDARLDDSRVRVKAHAGKVTLSGSVQSLYDRSAAITHAYAAGARNVDAGELRVKELETTQSMLRQKFSLAKDETIEQALKAAIAVDPRVEGEQVDVSVTNGIAKLTGSVDNLPAKQALIEDARAIAGVRQVSDQVSVKLARTVDDKALKDSVTASIRKEPGIEPEDVTVTVEKGRVTLRGKVDSNDERKRALTAAANVPGVLAVEDRLAIELARPGMSDSQLAAEVREQLFWSPYVDADQVSVRADRGVVLLTGDVDSWFEKEQAAENALQAGALRVDNKLQVTEPALRPQGP